MSSLGRRDICPAGDRLVRKYLNHIQGARRSPSGMQRTRRLARTQKINSWLISSAISLERTPGRSRKLSFRPPNCGGRNLLVALDLILSASPSRTLHPVRADGTVYDARRGRRAIRE